MTAEKTKESKKAKESKKPKDTKETKKVKEEKPKFSIGGLIKKLFGGFEMTWKRLIIFAVLAGVYTALMALLVPDGNSFHDIAVTVEAWVLLAIIVIANCKKPLEAAIKTFVFFLISQPLVYLLQVPFNAYGWGIFAYYPYWFKITLLTFPGAFVGWYIKKDNIVAGIIFSVAAAILIMTGVGYVSGFSHYFPNHLLSAIYCFAIIPIMAYGLFSKKESRITVFLLSIATLVAAMITIGGGKMYESYRSLSDYGFEYGNEPYVQYYSGTKKGEVVVLDTGEYYNLKLSGYSGGEYKFTLEDETGKQLHFQYHFDNEQLVLEEVKGGD